MLFNVLYYFSCNPIVSIIKLTTYTNFCKKKENSMLFNVEITILIIIICFSIIQYYNQRIMYTCKFQSIFSQKCVLCTRIYGTSCNYRNISKISNSFLLMIIYIFNKIEERRLYVIISHYILGTKHTICSF